MLDAPYGADVTVIAPNEEGARTIRTRARDLAKNVTSAGTGERCPLAVDNTTLVVTDIPGGAMISVKASKPEAVAPVRHVMRERASQFEAPSSSADPVARQLMG